VSAIALLVIAAAAGPVQEPGAPPPSADVPPEVAALPFEQRLDAQVPLDATFADEAGLPVRLGDLAGGRPVVLVLAYYRCPQLCNLVLNGLLDGLRGLTLRPGEDYTVVTVSFDPRETPEIAAAKKATYVEALGRPGAAGAWHFLTGGKTEIDRLAEAVGFHYAFDARHDRFNHPSGVVVLTPDGRVSRYLFGIRFPPRDLRLAVVEASAGDVGSLADQFLLYCFHYDPADGRYAVAVMNLIRAGGAVTALALAVFVYRAVRRDRRKTCGLWVAECGLEGNNPQPAIRNPQP
jgi:protein SCO1/2